MSDDEYVVEQIKLIEAVIETCELDINRNAWTDILNRIFDLLEDAEGHTMLEVFEVSKEDPIMWYALWLRIDGKPMLFTPVQQEMVLAFRNHRRVWHMMHRRGGKSLTCAAEICFNNQLTHDRSFKHICFSPVGRQDFIYSYIFDFHKQLENREFYKKYYLSKDTSNIYSKNIQLDNGNTIKNLTLGIKEEGRFALGETADRISIDEIQLLPEIIFIKVINPILASAFSEGMVMLVCTPDLEYNPNLQDWWDLWSLRDDRHTASYGWKIGVKEGLLREEDVMEAMEVEGEEGDSFCMMYRAIFPIKGQRFYKKEYFTRAGDMAFHDFVIGMNKWLDKPYKSSNELVMSADWGFYKDNFQVLVAEVIKDIDDKGGETRKLRYIYWYKATPDDKLTPKSGADIAKRIYHMFGKPRIYCDGNNASDVENLTCDGDYPAVDTCDIYSNETALKKDRYGIVMGNDFEKERLHMNHRVQLMHGNLLPPIDLKFRREWRLEHMSIKVEASKSGRTKYLYKKSTSHPDDLAMASVYMSWHIAEENEHEPAPTMILFRRY